MAITIQFCCHVFFIHEDFSDKPHPLSHSSNLVTRIKYEILDSVSIHAQQSFEIWMTLMWGRVYFSPTIQTPSSSAPFRLSLFFRLDRMFSSVSLCCLVFVTKTIILHLNMKKTHTFTSLVLTASTILQIIRQQENQKRKHTSFILLSSSVYFVVIFNSLYFPNFSSFSLRYDGNHQQIDTHISTNQSYGSCHSRNVLEKPQLKYCRAYDRHDSKRRRNTFFDDII